MNEFYIKIMRLDKVSFIRSVCDDVMMHGSRSCLCHLIHNQMYRKPGKPFLDLLGEIKRRMRYEALPGFDRLLIP